MTAGPSGYVLAVSLEPLDATTTLFFGHLGDGVAGALRVVRYGHPDLAAQLAGASAVVLVRALFEMEQVEWTCRVLGVPLYYFVDDNFMVLREQSGSVVAVCRALFGGERARPVARLRGRAVIVGGRSSSISSASACTRR